MQTNAFKILKTIHAMLVMWMAIFALIAVYVHQNNRELERILQVVCVIVSVASLVIGFNIFKRKMMAARNSPQPGKKKMAMYQNACIIWWAMIEGPGLLAIISFLLTGAYAFFALAIFHVVILLAFMPRKDNIVVLLNLNHSEVDQLEGKA